MAPATVVSSAHCCAGTPQCLSLERYYSRGTYPADGERVLYADIVFIGQSFALFAAVLALHCGLNKAVVLFIHSHAISVLSLISFQPCEHLQSTAE